ncbi:MAG: hypothetical protein ACC742_06370 [Thermoanaerobaculales bacterium]
MSPARRTSRLLGILILWAFTPQIVNAQQYGQWTWDAVLQANGRSNDNSLDGQTISRYQNRELRLSLGLNGFILHPSVARFRLQLDTSYNRFLQGAGADNFRFGGRANVGLFERGAFTVRLFYAQQQYDYTNLGGEDPITLASGLPDNLTSWGIRARVRRGGLRGLILGLNSSELTFVGPDDGSQITDNAFVDWSRAGKKLQHRVRLAREVRDFRRLDYSLDTTTFNWTESGWLAPTWRWDMFAIGIRQRSDFGGVAAIDTDTARLRSQFSKRYQSGDLLTLTYGFGYAGIQSGGGNTDHQLDVRYRWIFESGWELSPFAVYTVQNRGVVTVSIPQGGVAATWAGNLGAVDALFSGHGAYGATIASSDAGDVNVPFWSGSASFTLGHGNAQGLRKEFEVTSSHNEVRSAGDAIDNLPDLGVSFAAAATQNASRARLSLIHNWPGGGLDGWLEWRRNEAESVVSQTRLTFEGMLATAQLRWASFSVLANAGTSQIDDLLGQGQELSYAGASIGWRPWRSVRLNASYRKDRRQIVLAPNVDSDRIQGTVEFGMGRLFFRAEAFQYTERSLGGVERRNTGILWTVGRGFGGWLPIVTGPQRRGVIR